MQHMTEEQLVSHYYHDADAPADAMEHLVACPDCRTQYDTLARVLSLVKTVPIPDRGEDYGAEVWQNLRWKLGRRSRMDWQMIAVIAAGLAIAFFAGLLWRTRPESHPAPVVATATTPAPAIAQAEPVTSEEEPLKNDRFLLYVISDHLDTSERVLLEVANANPNRRLDNSGQQKRAEELVSANRLYRQAAVKQGDERIAELLAEIEPVLIELSHAGASINRAKVKTLQRRIESKGLLFKVRVISAQTSEGEESNRPVSLDTL
jgi:hypothetical protein